MAGTKVDPKVVYPHLTTTPVIGADGKSKINVVVNPATKMNAEAYKANLAKQFDVYGYTTNVSAIVSSNAEMYHQLSSAVSAIERGQKSNWDFSNLISGMNVASLDVRNASIELLEVCRAELMKLDEINKDPTLSAQQKKDKIAQEKAFIFGLLGDIRNANAREGTFKWTNDFLSSMGKKFGQSLNRTNFALAVLGVVFCVTVSALAAAGTLAFLGVCAPYALPFVIAGVCLFAFCKLVKGVYNAWQDANQLAAKSKTVSGNKVLDNAAKYKEKNLSIPQKEMEDAQATKEGVETTIAQKERELEAKILEVKAPLTKQLNALVLEEQTLKESRAEKDAIASAKPVAKKGRGGSGYTSLEIAEAKKALRDIEERLSLNSDAQVRRTAKLDTIASRAPVLGLVKEIDDLKKTKLAPATKLYGEKKSAYDTAKSAAEQSRARANKTPDPTTAARKGLGEILGDDSTATPTKKMGGSGV